MPNDDPAVVGSIARAARVLEALAARPDGAPLSQIVDATMFSKSTAHRVLAALQGVDYVAQDPDSRAYRLTGRFADLSRRAGIIDISAIAKGGMQRLAAVTGDTVFLSVPEGPAAVCAAREVGEYPIRTLTLDRGDRRPLGVGAGALALYCAMAPKTRAAVNRINRAWLAEYGFGADRLETEHARFMQRGYALNAGGVVAAMSAVGLPIVTRSGRLAGAVAVGAINERMDAARLSDLVLPSLRDEAARLGERLSDWEEEARL